MNRINKTVAKTAPGAAIFPFHTAEKTRKRFLPIVWKPLAESVVPLQKPAQVSFFRHAGVFRVLFEQQFLKKADSPFLQELEKPAEEYARLVREIAGRLCEKRVEKKERVAALRMVVDEIKSTVGVARDAEYTFISESLEKGGWNYESLAFFVFDVCRSLGMEPRIVDTSGGLFVASGRFVVNPMGMLRIMERREFDERGLHICYEGSDAVKMRYLHHMHIAYALVKEDFWGAIKELERAGNLNPNCVCTHLIKARFYGGREDFQNALICYNKTLKIAPEDTAVIEEKAHFLEQLGCLEDARAEYEELVRLKPGNIAHVLSLFHISGQIERKREVEWLKNEQVRMFEEALRKLNAYVADNLEDPNAYVERARFWRSYGYRSNAYLDYRYAFLLKPKDWKIWREIGFFLFFRGEYRNAIIVFERGHAATGSDILSEDAERTRAELAMAAKKAREKRQTA